MLYNTTINGTIFSNNVFHESLKSSMSVQGLICTESSPLPRRVKAADPVTSKRFPSIVSQIQVMVDPKNRGMQGTIAY